MKKLTPKSYWDNNSYNNSAKSTRASLFTRLVPKSFHTVDTNHVLGKYLKPGMKMLEIGVAPGLNSIAIANTFGVVPYGIDYSENGVKQAKKNFAAAGYSASNVFLGDLFDSKCRAKHRGKYDVVTSWGLIEHFDDPTTVVKYHAEFLRPGGLLIIEVPNIRGVNKFFCHNIKDLYNHDIMSLEALTKTIPRDVKIIEKDLCGGLMNFGLYFSDNRFLEILRLITYGVQRLTLDQIQRLLLLANIRLKYKYTTPDMIIIGRKTSR